MVYCVHCFGKTETIAFDFITLNAEAKHQRNSSTIIKFLPLDFLPISHRITWKNKNTAYHFQTSVLVPEIFKFEKWVKCANEMTDDVIHFTQYYVEYRYLNWATSANLQRTPLKLTRLIVLQETHLQCMAMNISFPWQLTLFHSPPI